MKLVTRAVSAVLTIWIGLAVFMPVPANAQVLESNANPVKMVLTPWGGVSLERQGQESFFKAWNSTDNSFVTLGIDKTNIQSFDIEDKLLVYIKRQSTYSEVYTYNLDSKQSVRVDRSYSKKEDVKISGNYLVWEDYDGGRTNIGLFNLSTGEYKVVAGNSYTTQTNPDVSSKYIAWIDSKNGYEVIKAVDLAGGASTLIRDTINDKLSLALYEDKIVWAELREGSGGVRVPSSNQYFEDLWASSIGANSVYDLWMYDLGTGTTTRLTNSSINHVQPAIWDHYVAWVETSSGNPDLYLSDLSTGKTSRIAQTDAYEVQPSLGFGYISWVALQGNIGSLNVQALNIQPATGENGSAAGDEIKVLVNGSRYFMNPNPYIKNDRTMVPMRRIFEILGAQVTWNEAEASVTAVRGNDTVKLFIGSTTAYKNGSPVLLDAAPEILADRTMVPLRFVAQATGYQVDWEEFTKTVTINSGF